MAENNEENKALLEGLRKKKNKKTGKMELFWDDNGSEGSEEGDSSEYSETDSEEYVDENERFLGKSVI